MRKFLRRLLPVALVASMVGFVVAASSSTKVTTSTASLVPVAGKILPNLAGVPGKVAVPTTASGKLVHTVTTVVQNGTTFPTVQFLSGSVKGLLAKSADLADGQPVTFNVGAVALPAANLSNGSATVTLDSSVYKATPGLKKAVKSGAVVFVGTATVAAAPGVLTGVIGVPVTTTK